MSAILAIRIDGEPVGKGRPKLSTRNGFARAYTPAKTRTWEGGAEVVARTAWGSLPPLDRPVLVLVRAVKGRPKTLTRKSDPSWRLWRVTRPDVDNVCKAALDALVNAGVLVDDTYCVELRALSLYAAKGEGPCVEVEIHEPHPLNTSMDRRLYGANGGAE